MTSMLKRVDNAVQAFIGDFVDGNVEGGTDVINDLRPTASAWPPPVASSTTSRTNRRATVSRSSTARSRSRPPRDPDAGPLLRARVRTVTTTAGPGASRPGPPSCRPRSARPGAGLPPGAGCDIMRRAAIRAERSPGPASRRDGRPRRRRRRRVDVRRAPAAAPEGEAHHGRNRSDRQQRRRRDARRRRAVRRRAARHHQALPRRRRQPRHRAAGPPRRGARDRRRERRRQVDADEDPLRHAPPGRGHDPASTAARCSFRSPADAIAAGIGMVHQHFMLADNFTVLENIVLGSEPTRGGRLDRAEARAPDPRDLRPVRASASTPTRSSRTSASATGSGSRSPRCSTAAPAS